MPLHRPRKGQKSSFDDGDPFWDSWDKEPIVLVEQDHNVRRRRNKNAKKKQIAVAASDPDPFGRDGFGDDWNKPAPLIPRLSIEQLLPEDFVVDRGEEEDWGRMWSDDRLRAEAERKQRKEDRIKEAEASLAASKARMKKRAESEAKAAADKAAEEKAAEEKAAAEEEWHRRVREATDSVTFGLQAEALNLLYSLSIDNEVVGYIDKKEKDRVAQMYATWYNDYELQNSLPLKNDSYLDRSSSESVASKGDESSCTIGGDTVKLNQSHTEGEEEDKEGEGEEDSEIETTNTAFVVDRLSIHQSDESGQDVSSIDDCTDSSDQINAEEQRKSEIDETAVVHDRGGYFSTHRNVNEIATERVNAANRILHDAFVQSLELLEGIMQQHGAKLTSKGKQELEQKILLQRKQLNVYQN